MAPSYGLILQNTDKICRKTQNAHPIFLVFVFVFIPNGLPKTIHNSALSTASELSQTAFLRRLNRESLLFQTTLKSASETSTTPSYELWNITP